MTIDIDKVIRQARAQGFRYQRTEKNHHQFYAANGKDIIVHSGTSSDTRGDDNFMADMKRAGYQHGLNGLGEHLASALKLNMKPPNGGGKLTVSQYVIDALSRHPEGMDNAGLEEIVRTQRPEISRSAVSQATTFLCTKNQIRRVERGFYKLGGEEAPKLNGATHHPPPTPASAPTVEAGARTGDISVDRDLEILDRALAALADIEEVVRKNREVLAQLAALKRMLGLGT